MIAEAVWSGRVFGDKTYTMQTRCNGVIVSPENLLSRNACMLYTVTKVEIL